jgi:hypothetical protein
MVENVKEGFKKLVDEQGVRVQSMFEEMAKLEARSMEQARVAIDESTRLMKSALDYQAQLSAEWRKLALEAAKRATELVTPKV